MTDLEKLEALLKEFKVAFTVDEYDDGTPYIHCEACDKRVEGYYGFYTKFVFSEKGKFKKMVIAE